MSWDQGSYDGHQQAGYGGYNDYGQQQGGYGGQQHQQGGYSAPEQPGYGAPPPQQGQYFQPSTGQAQGGWNIGGPQQGGWGGPSGGDSAPGVNFGGAQLPIDPLVTNMAMNYAGNMYDQNKDEIKKIGDQIEQVKNKRDDQSTRIPLSSSEQHKKNQKEINQLVKLQKEL